MINNRQAGRRNRGRNNGRQGGGNRGGGDNGNRIDSRARGNAPQLLEKYRNMARDAQLAGDRVNTEYYLQFADHYFRVIADNRARQEEGQTRFRRNDESLDYDDDQGGSGDDDLGGAASSQASDGRERQGGGQERGEGRQGQDRAQRGRQYERPAYDRASSDEEAEGDIDSDDAEASAASREDEPRRGGRGRPARKPREAVSASADDAAPAFDLTALPPAISRADNDSDEAQAAGEAPAPRRRGRPPRAAAEAAE